MNALDPPRGDSSFHESVLPEYQAAKADDETAVGLIENAMKALESFYEEQDITRESSMSLMQKKSQAPGEAPAPPPSTFEGDYTGAQGETDGVIRVEHFGEMASE